MDKTILKDLNYLNMQEIKNFCNTKKIPYYIHIQKDRRLYKTRELDRKGIVLKRIKSYLKTGNIGKPTIFPQSVVSVKKLPVDLKSHQQIFYGEYKNKNKKILQLMKKLTNDEFEFGAIAQETIRACWEKGITPTYQEFATLWLAAKKARNKPNPEWAYLTDRKEGKGGADWKKLRAEKAKKVLNHLKSVT